GIGGLSVLQALRHELPHERFVYLADSGNAPYGDARGDAFVQQRTRTIARHLCEQHQIKVLVLACNTATAAAVDMLRAEM
ncbi:aspartate/glutamate racemase family protein, partial [Mycobacterium tuberculosis]|nr:aspartate/glutamate racemase family protein [Mycobacterium tuberculosis]